ncbi:protein of unknown function [Stenotrophomonas maltophilia]|nr:protein of unknown function [Stenotrophomonas maltophilia]
MVRGARAQCVQPDRHSACAAHVDPVRRPPDPHLHRHRPRGHPRFAAADPPLRQAHHRRAATVQARDRLTGSAGRWPAILWTASLTVLAHMFFGDVSFGVELIPSIAAKYAKFEGDQWVTARLVSARPFTHPKTRLRSHGNDRSS